MLTMEMVKVVAISMKVKKSVKNKQNFKQNN
jgi:hypothetical protein